MRQRTIKDPVTLRGKGLQTGADVAVTFKSAPANSGINFIRVDLPTKPLLNIQSLDLDNSGAPERRTTIGIGSLQIQTTEHLLAALAGLSIDNIVVEIDNVELPGLDGSAKQFFDALQAGTVVEQEAARRFLEIKDVIWCAQGDAMIAAFPDKDFKVSYLMSYDNPAIGTHYFSAVITKESFEGQIAPARTFCLEEEAEELLKRGLGKGADHNNTLVLGKNGPVQTTCRFPNEPVRHKVLDLVGDLYLLGMPIKGHVVAIKSGHKLNMELVKKLKAMK